MTTLPANQKDIIKIGFIEDYYGDLSIYGLAKNHAAQLAIKEINDGFTLLGGPLSAPGRAIFAKYASKTPSIYSKGSESGFSDKGGELTNNKVLFVEEDKIIVQSGHKGLLGRKVVLISADGKSDLKHWKLQAKKLIQNEKVDVLFAGFTSSSREAIRPIVDKSSQLYFYTNQYEGGLADKNTICSGAVCEQQVLPLLQFMINAYGPRIYTIAADYNFGRLTAAWTKACAPLFGGKVIAEEFVSLGVSKFKSVINHVKDVKPDWVMTLIIGAAQQNYYPQAASAGLSFPMASTVNMAQGYEHVRFSTPALANMHNAVNYMMEIPTPRNKAFVKRWFNMFPDDAYIGQMAQNTYFSIHLYAKAVMLAGSVNQREVLRTLESGLHLEAPEGSIFLDPSTHHIIHYIRLAKSDDRHHINFMQEWPNISPWWLQRLGVNLVRKPEYKQYVPSDDKYFGYIKK